MAELFNDLMVGYLPRRFQLQGFVSEKQERALLSALPIIVSIHQGVQQGDVQKKWDLFTLLDPASRFAQAVKNVSDGKAIDMVEAAAAQVQIGEGTSMGAKFKSLFDELPLLAVLFGLVLKKGEKARDPAITVEKFLTPYASDAFAPSESASQSGLFAARGKPDAGKDPAIILATELGIRLPGAMREAVAPQARLIANPSMIPPESVARAARIALEIRSSVPRSRRAGTRVGLARANQLAGRRPVSEKNDQEDGVLLCSPRWNPRAQGPATRPPKQGRPGLGTLGRRPRESLGSLSGGTEEEPEGAAPPAGRREPDPRAATSGPHLLRRQQKGQVS